MFSLLLQIDEEDQDPIIADLWERGTTGLVQRYQELEAFFDDDADRAALLQSFSGLSPKIVTHAETDWVRQTQESFPAQLVGEKFFLTPPWNDDPTPPGRVRLEINPGLACGTGWHPCTRMCLQALEQTVRSGDRILDVGVGSGILTAAAELLGAAFVTGCDIDPEAISVARERVEGPLFVGSADAIAPDAFDVLVANISAKAVRELLPEFERVAGRLILSGFQIAPDFERTPEFELESEGWRCLVLRSRRLPAT